ncbi:hypothetical protein LCGC14_1491800 [marine sediment metagenome]|uniref:Uncharacterized protein n=1 Tax=marine sediment metagenome TaxID=412755 RepID=A0A0F9LM28_9ZZZZ
MTTCPQCIELECPTCKRDRVDVQMQLDEAREWSEKDVLTTILRCPECRTFFKREQKQEVKA